MTLLRRHQPTWTGLLDDAFFKDFFEAAPKSFGNVTKSVPAVNVKETDTAFKVEVAAPGVKKEDFNINVDEDRLTISTEAKQEHEEKDKEGRYTKREFSYQSFSRSFSLNPEQVDVENISANYENGILHLEIPKKTKEETKVKKTIEVK
jgi:HSP20 family protein